MNVCPYCKAHSIEPRKLWFASFPFPAKCPACGGESFAIRGITSWWVHTPIFVSLSAAAFWTLPIAQAGVSAAAIFAVAAWALSGESQLLPVSLSAKVASRLVLGAVLLYGVFHLARGAL
jgi:hypothetical protein